MTSPRFSIVTPSFNQEAFLADNLRSVRNQERPDIEHIILDAGSTDGSVERIESYAEAVPYDVRWRSEPDDGQSSAINEGLQKARGDIVGWLNSDDVYFDTGVFDRVSDYFSAGEMDVLYGDLAYVNGDSRVVEIDVRPPFDPALLRHRVLIGQPATFFRRPVVAAESLDTSLDYCMDYEFWIRLAEQFQITHVNEVLAGFRVHKDQKTEDAQATESEVAQMLEEHRNRLPATTDSVVGTNVRIEVRRYLASLDRTISLYRDPPSLAFDGAFAPLPSLLLAAGPDVRDVLKVNRRFFS